MFLSKARVFLYLFHILRFYIFHVLFMCPSVGHPYTLSFRTYILRTCRDSPQLFVYQTTEVSSLSTLLYMLLILYLLTFHVV